MSTEDLDPKPGDFDDELASIDPRDVEIVERSEHADVSIQVTMHGDDAARLERLAHARGQRPGEVVAQLVREADRHAA